jgi:hypothetical protein
LYGRQFFSSNGHNNLNPFQKGVSLLKTKENENQKNLKLNSYEMEKEQKETIHLKQAPKPHTFGHLITEDIE